MGTQDGGHSNWGSDNDWKNADIIAVLVCCLLTGFGFMWYRRRNKVLAAGVDDDEVIGTLGDTEITAGEEKVGYDMSPIGMDTADNPDAENEIMIEVEVTETQH